MGEAKRRGTFEQRKSNPTNLSKSFAVDKDRLTEVLVFCTKKIHLNVMRLCLKWLKQ
jgi:hypothetical protein